MSIAKDVPGALKTADDLMRMPDDGRRYELVRGVILEMTPTGGLHGGVATNVGYLLQAHVRSHALGRVLHADRGYCLHETGSGSSA